MILAGDTIPKHQDFQKVYNSMVKQYGKDKGEEVYYSYVNKNKYDDTKPMPKQKEHLFSKGLNVKESTDKNLVVEGFIATNHIDKSLDFIPDSTLVKIAEKINTREANKLSLHHNLNETTVAGMMKNAEIRDTGDGHKGVWVEAVINKVYPSYSNTEYEIQNGMIDGFSIEYYPEATHVEPMNVNGRSEEVRYLDNIDFVGVGLASKPVNPGAQIMNYAYKEFINFNDNNAVTQKEANISKSNGVIPMGKKPKQPEPAEEPEKEETAADESAVEEEKEVKVEETAEYKEFIKWKAESKAKEAKELRLAEVKEIVKTMMPANMPLIQTGANVNELQVKETMNSISNYQKRYMECKEWVPRTGTVMSGGAPTRKTDVALQLKEAANLQNSLTAAGKPLNGSGMRNFLLEGKCILGRTEGTATQDFVMADSHFKELEVKANPLATSTNKISDTSYYQTAAEFADVYDPVIYNLLNDKTTTYGLLKKVDASNFGDRYGFRVRYARSTVAGFLAEGETGITPSSQSRLRCQQPFVYAYSAVRVTGPAIAAARAQGGVGDLFADEVKWATVDLLRSINSKILTGTQDGIDDGYECLGLTYLCEKGSSYTELYGLNRNTYHLEGNSEALSTENISKGELRKMIRACTSGDSSLQQNNAGAYSAAREADLIFIMHPVQKDKVLALFDDAQRFAGVSARAGFEGMPTFDGIPIHSDVQCTNSVAFCIDTANTFLVVQVPPTFEAWGNQYNYDLKSGFIKTYFNLVCTAPGNNCEVTGLKTT